MSPRLPFNPLRALTRLCPPREIRAPFSGTSQQQADDPLRGLQDALSPAKTPRPRQNPITSRSPSSSLGSDSSNPFLLEIPPAEPLPRASRPAGVSEPQWQDTNRPTRTALKRPPAPSFDAGPQTESSLASTLLRYSRAQGSVKLEQARKAQNVKTRQIENQIGRTWRDGDVYAPHDLSPVEMRKARQAKYENRTSNMPALNSRSKGGRDVLDDLGIDPLKEYKNFAMMGEFMTDLGRIRHSRDTGLRAVNQRRMAKAVRRAIGIGIMPSVHQHPELHEERTRMRTW